MTALQLFEAALDQSADRRQAFLEEACGTDGELLREVESLLALHGNASRFLDTDAIQLKNDTRGMKPVHQEESPRLTHNDNLLERYQVIETLGRGGMGEVYRCKDLYLRREVAIKVQRLSTENDQDMRDRFLREIRSVAVLSHPNIVTLHDFATDDGLSFAVMELVEGQTLDRWLEENHSDAELIQVAQSIASGLAAAHGQLLMHRDIKPANIIVVPNGSAKILDFGLARPARTSDASDITGPLGAVPGTPPYMSPEQARGEELSCSTDVFSFGTILFEMFTRENPYRLSSVLESLARVSDADAITERLPAESSIPKGIAELIRSMQNRAANETISFRSRRHTSTSGHRSRSTNDDTR
ncbi:MAG: serine/threonine-protein kinase [Planctomycetota bacterium]